MKLSKKQLLITLPLAISMTLLTGCARKPVSQNDPLEGYNRVAFAFNQDIDHLVMRPVATVYNTVTPTVLRKGVTNVFANLGEGTTFVNDILQFNNPKYAMLDFWRFVVNTTVGIGGLFDVASRMGMPKHVETFGMTLAKWRGGKSSPYFVIPFLGPSTIQNAIGTTADQFTRPWVYLNSKYDAYRYSALGLRIVNTRARFMDANKLIDTAFDPYVFVRDGYMQNVKERIRKNQMLGQKPEKNGVATQAAEPDFSNGHYLKKEKTHDTQKTDHKKKA